MYLNGENLFVIGKIYFKEGGWRSATVLNSEVIYMAIDPICKMEVDEATAKFKSEHKGRKFFFCAPGCKKEFDKNPDKYV